MYNVHTLNIRASKITMHVMHERPGFQFDTFMALRADVKALKSKVSSVEEQILTLKGRSGRWGSGWMEFDERLDLYKGDALLIKVGGTAQRVLVRLLPHGKSADFPIGILPDRLEVPPNREILVESREDYKGISQISVHGGPKPWGKYSLGENNGPATIEDFRIKRR